MKELFLDKSIELIQQYHDPYTEEEIELLRYGLEGIYLTVTKLVIIILLSFILHIEKEVLLLLILFNIIRFTGFGVHARTSTSCLITSTLFFIIIPYVFLQIQFTIIIKMIICGLCLISYILYAPADTIKRPLYNQKKRKTRKLITVIIGLIYSFGSICIQNTPIQSMLLAALLIQSIVILPITYRLLKVPYQNWKQCSNSID